MTAQELVQLIQERDDANPFCAILGPVQPRAVEGASLIAGSLGIPQLAYATTDRRLSRSQDFPSFRRLIPQGEDYAMALAQYLQRDTWRSDYIGLLYDDSDYGELFEHSLETASVQYNYDLIAGHMVEGDESSVKASLERILQKGYRTVVVATDRPAVLEDIAVLAEELGMLNGDFVWVLSGDALPPAMQPFLQNKIDSPMDKLLRGAALFTNYDRFVYEGKFNNFYKVWREQAPSLVEEINAMQPLDKDGNPLYLATKGYFQNESPTEYSSFIYDAVMTAGASACMARLRGVRGRAGNHVQQVLTTEFTGASGPVSFYDKENKIFQTSRNVDGVLFGMYNVRPKEADEDSVRG